MNRASLLVFSIKTGISKNPYLAANTDCHQANAVRGNLNRKNGGKNES
jgi:hypothetical protein